MFLAQLHFVDTYWFFTLLAGGTDIEQHDNQFAFVVPSECVGFSFHHWMATCDQTPSTCKSWLDMGLAVFSQAGELPEHTLSTHGSKSGQTPECVFANCPDLCSDLWDMTHIADSVKLLWMYVIVYVHEQACCLCSVSIKVCGTSIRSESDCSEDCRSRLFTSALLIEDWLSSNDHGFQQGWVCVSFNMCATFFWVATLLTS